MAEKALILSADSWEMQDERTGVINRGVSLWYINDYRDDTENGIGSKPIKCGCTAEVFAKIKKAGVPGVFSLDFRTRPGAQGKPSLTLVDVTLIRSLPIDALFASVAPTSNSKSA